MVNHFDIFLFEFTVPKQDCDCSTWTQCDPPCNGRFEPGSLRAIFRQYIREFILVIIAADAVDQTSQLY